MLHSKTFRTRSIGWALLNFRPLQKIEAIIGGVGGYLIVGPFSRDYGNSTNDDQVFLQVVLKVVRASEGELQTKAQT